MKRQRTSLPDDNCEILIVLEDGTFGVVTIGDVRRAIDERLPRLMRAIYDNAPVARLLMQRSKRTRK